MNEMSWVIVDLKCLKICRISTLSTTSVEHSFLAVVFRHLIKPLLGVSGWCESNCNFLFLLIDLGMEFCFFFDENECVVDISPLDSRGDGSRPEHCVFIPFHEDVGQHRGDGRACW